jgi:hypothetical protein
MNNYGKFISAVVIQAGHKKRKNNCAQIVLFSKKKMSPKKFKIVREL